MIVFKIDCSIADRCLPIFVCCSFAIIYLVGKSHIDKFATSCMHAATTSKTVLYNHAGDFTVYIVYSATSCFHHLKHMMVYFSVLMKPPKGKPCPCCKHVSLFARRPKGNHDHHIHINNMGYHPISHLP